MTALSLLRRPLRARRSAPPARAPVPIMAAVGLLLAGLVATVPAIVAPQRATAAPAPEPLDILQYNVQFLTPIDGFAIPGHWPNTSTRAAEIGRQISCFDVVALDETVHDGRRGEVLAAMEAAGAACGKASRLAGGRQFNATHGPDLAPGTIKLPTPTELADLLDSDANPIVDDEVTIVSRLPIISTHMHRFTQGSGVDGFAAKGIVHARLWSCCAQPTGAAVDVFATHLDTERTIRDSQLVELADFVRAHGAPERPTVILGDMNIVGNAAQQADASSEYSRMMSTLRSRVNANVTDVGRGLGNTNEERTQRIDYVLEANTLLSAGRAAVEEFPHATAAAPHTTLSDHAGVSLRGATWTPPELAASPGTGEPKRLRVQVTRLESLTTDACNDFTDYTGRGSVTAAGVATATSFGLREGNDVGPDWTVTRDLGTGVADARVTVEVDDDDDVVCGGGDDEIDVTDIAGTRLMLSVDFAGGVVRLVDSAGAAVRVLGRIGQPFSIAGTSGDRSRITVTVAAQRLATEPPPPVLPTDRERVVRTTVHRLRATSTDSCNARMDFMGRLELRNGVPATVQNFGVREGNDISPGWFVEAVAPAGVATVDTVIRITDDDDLICGGGDDEVDVNPSTADRLVRLRIDLATQRLRFLDPALTTPGAELGFAGRTHQLQGANGDETGIIDLSVTIHVR